MTDEWSEGDWDDESWNGDEAEIILTVHAYKKMPFTEWKLGLSKGYCFRKHSCTSMVELNNDLYIKKYTEKDHIKKIFPQYFI